MAQPGGVDGADPRDHIRSPAKRGIASQSGNPFIHKSATAMKIVSPKAAD
jgi:hypothetical protein